MAETSLVGKGPIALAHFGGKFIGFIRSNAFVRLNDIAEVTEKRLDSWMRLKETKEYLEAFRKDPSYNGMEPLRVVKGNFSPNKSDTTDLRYHSTTFIQQGTWAHPDIAIEFARWCSPAFGLWCNRQIRHLLTHGEVNLHHKEWSLEQHQQGIQYNRDDIEEMYGPRR